MAKKIKARAVEPEDGFDSGDGLGFDFESGLEKLGKVMNGDIPESDLKDLKETKSNKEITATDEFDPEDDGLEAQKLIKNMGKMWVSKAVVLGGIIERAKDFYGKDKGGFSDWTVDYCRIKYPMAMQLIRVSKLNPDTVQKIIDRGFTSSHVIKLLSLKYETQQVEFLEEEEHAITEDDDMVKTKEMTPKDVQDAIKLINKKPDPEISPTQEFYKVMKTIEAVLDKTADDFNKYVVENDNIDITELSENQLAVVLSAKRMLKCQTDDYLAVMKKIMPIEEK